MTTETSNKAENSPMGYKKRWLIAGLAATLLFVLTMVLRDNSNSGKRTSRISKRQAMSPSKTSEAFAAMATNPADILGSIPRPGSTRPPSALTQDMEGPYTTNQWYQNLLLLADHVATPDSRNNAYAIPYMIDASGPISGLRVNPVYVSATQSQVFANYASLYGLTMGVTSSTSNLEGSAGRYSVKKTTPLSVTIGWEKPNVSMETPIVRGMPFATMVYHWTSRNTVDELPTLAAEVKLSKPPLADGSTTVPCDTGGTVEVLNELLLHFDASDATWLAVPSRSTEVSCRTIGDKVLVQFHPEQSSDFILRIALANDCTTGRYPNACNQEKLINDSDTFYIGTTQYVDWLRSHSHLYPGPDSSIATQVSEEDNSVYLTLDWDQQTMRAGNAFGRESDSLGMLSLAHHRDSLLVEDSRETQVCTHSLLGPACSVDGSRWVLKEEQPWIDFRAPRPPKEEFWPDIAQALNADLKYQVFELFRRGGGDTYFSAKALAKLGRICLIAEEMRELCVEGTNCYDDRPSDENIAAAILELKESVGAWFTAEAETPFVYDDSWGGVISCGCMFDGGVGCKNKPPNCPAFSDPLLNFGNGLYNDQHFHYGYYIYCAAIIAHFDPEWGRQFFERVMLLVRSVANPNDDDPYFSTWRHKDWYVGSSWASGINSPPFNEGRNQESSSEALAAYESVALYGRVMSEVWQVDGNTTMMQVSDAVEETGEAMLATELRSARRYWQLHDENEPVYPSNYGHYVIGIVWQTMVIYSTWFGNNPEYIYGIQLLPLTPIAESRDSLPWLHKVYGIYASACQNVDCSGSGWKVLQTAILATIGYQKDAVDMALALPENAFLDPSGNGHSLSNTLWYIATRPHVQDPISLGGGGRVDAVVGLDNCDSAVTCTDEVLDRLAGENTCRARMKWLLSRGTPLLQACSSVASEYPAECGACMPGGVPEIPSDSDVPSDPEIPAYPGVNSCDTPETCTKVVLDRMAGEYTCGARMEWVLSGGKTCLQTCSLVASEHPAECGACDPEAQTDTKSPTLQPTIGVSGAACPRCSVETCKGPLNMCPPDSSAPFVCTAGPNLGGCKSGPWPSDQHCFDCCDLSRCLEHD